MLPDEGTEVPAREFIHHLVESKDYCVFEVRGIEWHYVFTTLLDRWRDKDAPKIPPTIEEPGKFGILYAGERIFYWVRRGSIPPKALAKAFGLPQKQTRNALYIKLRPLDEGVPKVAQPTVDYYGLA